MDIDNTLANTTTITHIDHLSYHTTGTCVTVL